MNEHVPIDAVSRRAFLGGAGALIVSFSMLRARAQEAPVPAEPEPPELPGALSDAPLLDSWIRIDADGHVTVFTGKAELGQGIKTAILQVAAEELEVDPASIALITADTALTPDEGFTAGSQSMQNSGTAVRNAAAQVRELLIARAAQQLGVPATKLSAENGTIIGGTEPLGYGALVADNFLHVNAQPNSKLKAAADFKVMGRSLGRVDIPGKVTGGVAYVQDLRFDGMLHGRIIRPPSNGAQLTAVDTAAAEAMPGVVQIVRDGSFLAVVAEREFTAIKAMRALAAAAQWEEQENLPDPAQLFDTLRTMPVEDGVVADTGTAPVGVAQTYEATFTRPYQIHGSIGPSCAVGHLQDNVMTVWSHTQGVYPDREAIAEMLRMPPEQVHVIHVEGSGCYGHNGADDAAADAALLARAVPGRPVRVQWMREQEHAWEPFGPGMVTHIEAGIDAAGRIASWSYELWSNTHATRPGPAGALLPARSLASPFAPEVPELNISPNGNGDRNADPLYTLPSKRVIWHFIRDMPLRVSALRALGAYANVFSIESAIDELAILAGADPVEFRLAHLDDERARDVVQAAADRFGWAGAQLPEGHGKGFAFARYKNSAAYVALALEVEVQRETGRCRVVRAAAAIDSGEVVNPDGIRNQTEGGIVQAMSWTLYEAVSFDRTRITSTDWASYPILRFTHVPDSIDIEVMDRPGEPFLGTGEAATGPTAGAIGNAIRDATGVRLTDLPFRPAQLKAALRG
jgi:CO/xanthine dehydrogenase Mo-binding subunit